jgi:hypothetical protein
VSLTLPGEALEALAEHLRELIGGAPSEGATEDRWMDTKAAAAYLGYTSVSPLQKLTAMRRVPFSQDVAGGKCWFLRSELDSWRRDGGAYAS